MTAPATMHRIRYRSCDVMLVVRLGAPVRALIGG